MKALLLTLIFSSSLWATPFDIRPDMISSHCEAFGGNWTTNGCRDRMEYQQRSVSPSTNIGNRTQWCEARGGEYRRGRCSGTRAAQGLRRVRSASSARFQAHEDIVNSCLTNNRVINQRCHAFATTEDNHWFDYTGVSRISRMDGVKFLIDLNSALSFEERPYSYEGGRERDYVISTLRNYLARNDLSSCQQACLIKCASSTIVSYQAGKEMKSASVTDIYNQRVGECTEFSTIATDLGEALGIGVQSKYAPGHAFNYFEINGEWYYGEPQSDECEFYHAPTFLSDAQDRDPQIFNRERSVGKSSDESSGEQGQTSSGRVTGE